MKVGIIVSFGLNVQPENYLPEDVSEIISDGNTNIRNYALKKNIPLTEILPDYKNNFDYAELNRNLLIKKRSDLTLIFLDGNKRNAAYYASIMHFSAAKTKAVQITEDYEEYLCDV